VTKWTIAAAETGDAQQKKREKVPSSVSCDVERVVHICGSPVPCMAVSPDGLRIVAGDTQGSIHIFDAKFLKKVRSFKFLSSFSLLRVLDCNHHLCGFILTARIV
jgi:hypothetical protein